ncbi:phosphatase PAP2 family protein [Mesorhizobium sp. B2-7-1]|uniref:phosphatase PAP2 family protein n=1 Tax=Mesorhizobium sp. B2-7-1 TaxID=2589909 RepID=UPI001126BF91|nr:phosphatase PAP2 family protein [Mesorhizobium sp. B2-7-1]TPJ63459.1 Ser/Thr and Tyr protein phosphatase [Mesorhizobium sp. B2-7-1]
MEGGKKNALRAYGYWAGINLIVFALLFPLADAVAEWRGGAWKIYFDFELRTALMPQFILPYHSMSILFLLPPFLLNASEMAVLGKRVLVATLLGCATFLIMPAQLGFVRVMPDGMLYQRMFAGIFLLDGTHNLVPSLHVVYASLSIYSYSQAVRRSGARVLLWLWWCLIVSATLLVHQHHLADVVSGLALAFLLCCWDPSTRVSRRSAKTQKTGIPADETAA